MGWEDVLMKQNYLGEKLVDDAIAHTSSSARGATLLANGIQLVEDDDMQTALIALLLVLHRWSVSWILECTM